VTDLSLCRLRRYITDLSGAPFFLLHYILQSLLTRVFPSITEKSLDLSLLLSTSSTHINITITHQVNTTNFTTTKMPSSYRITEPHPSVPATTSTIYYGRGGAGNITRVSQVTSGPDASGPASRVKLTPPPSNARFLSGRGGAGNVHREKERAMFSFDEELAQQERLREHAAPVYHIGRGGAGNLIDEAPRNSLKARTNSTSSRASDESESNVRRSVESTWRKMTRQFSHN